jgi:hypothetical protein
MTIEHATKSGCKMMKPRIGLLFAVLMAGCGPSAAELREQTVSLLNTEADRWDGGKNFATTAVDAYGHPLTSTVTKTTFHYVLEIRSNGPDALPKNSDDIVVTRSKRHTETSLTEQAAKAVESVSSGAASGIIQGIKKELGSGGKKK